MDRELRIKFGNQMRALREKRGLTQQKLAELAELDYRHIQRLESKNPTNANLETIEKLAKAFGISRKKLLDF